MASRRGLKISNELRLSLLKANFAEKGQEIGNDEASWEIWTELARVPCCRINRANDNDLLLNRRFHRLGE